MKIQKFLKMIHSFFVITAPCCNFVEYAIFVKFPLIISQVYHYEFMVTYFCTSEILLMKRTLTVDLIFILSWLLSGAFDKCFIIIVLFTISICFKHSWISSFVKHFLIIDSGSKFEHLTFVISTRL